MRRGKKGEAAGGFAEAVQASVRAREMAAQPDTATLDLCLVKAAKLAAAERFAGFLAVDESTLTFRNGQAVVRVTTPPLDGWEAWYVLGDPAVAFAGDYSTRLVDGSKPWPLVVVQGTEIRPFVELADLAEVVG